MKRPQKLILSCPLCPGDLLTLTAAIESLHLTYPGEYLTDVRTPVPALFEHNPRITPIDDDDKSARRLELHYHTNDNPNSINYSDGRSLPFLGGYCGHLATLLGRPIPLSVARPLVYLSDEEKRWINQVRQTISNGRDVPFWLVAAGVKSDYTAKQWPVEFYQEVIDRTLGRVLWVQIGETAPGHDHIPLRGAINFLGKTDTRQLVRLAWHAGGGLGPVTFLQHLMAAHHRPYICLLGGREPVVWTQYQLQQTLHTLGNRSLPCCAERACWKSRIVPDDKPDPKNASLCEFPVFGLTRPVGKCMATIRPEDVLASLRLCGVDL